MMHLGDEFDLQISVYCIEEENKEQSLAQIWTGDICLDDFVKHIVESKTKKRQRAQENKIMRKEYT